MSNWFRKFAHKTSMWAGSPNAFLLACVIIIVWGLTGHMFHYSDTWQLIINTGTTIVTFLMVFLIQATQNRDGREFHLKIDELIRANKDARNTMINLEHMSEAELDKLHAELCATQEVNEARLEKVVKTRQSRKRRN